MRLKPRDIEALKTAARETFGSTAGVRLHGSRAMVDGLRRHMTGREFDFDDH